MSTDQLSVSKRRRRINRTPEFKTKIVAACLHVGVSVTAIAREYGLNPNLVHRWVREFEKSQRIGSPGVSDRDAVQMEPAISPSFIELPFKAAAVQDVCTDQIELDLQRGDLTLKVKWPASNALECVHIIKALFKC